MTYYLCGYFRGQLLIALSNCVLFTLGFLLIDFPMPLALGCFIGLLSFVPYVQVVGFLPATLLALLRAAESHENFWVLIGGVVAVYLVVQIIQDTVVTPRIMGHIMGLSPAIILLALSIGAAIGGIGGLIIALPLTTIALLYYRRYVVGDTTGLAAEEAAAKEPEATKDE
jgi:predicted PurR-regulated permease PerM